MKYRAIAVVVAVLALTGCGTDKAAENTKVAAAVQAGDKYNDTDVMYLQMMVAHHEQGLEMVEIAEKSAKKPELLALAKAVDVTQADEVTLMKGWLEGWSKPTTVDHAPNAHADHGGLPATGPEEMRALRDATGGEFETTFINLFVAHQHNAVEMANMERTGGANTEAKALAERVRQSRTDQIRQLLTMLNG
ncbi:DUF305 domain-containing protein [Actinoplanes sp. NBRC 103695]|nr:DUF305 domain-containing protein [Actinoplanes sp. NBRC 103695]